MRLPKADITTLKSLERYLGVKIKLEYNSYSFVVNTDLNVAHNVAYVEGNSILGLRLGSIPDNITEIPELIFSLKNLISLTISNSNINSSSSRIKELTQLKTLALENNMIKNIPNPIFDLTSVTNLSLSKNKITRVPLALNRLKDLIYLDLSHNQISGLKLGVFNFPKLTILRLHHNYIGSTSNKVKPFSKLPSLRLLDISNNVFKTSVPNSALDCKLDCLLINNNKLTTVQKRVFEHPTLIHLNLAQNNIKFIPVKDLSHNFKLQSLFLDGNILTRLPTFLFSLKRLHSLSIEDNPFSIEVNQEIIKLQGNSLLLDIKPHNIIGTRTPNLNKQDSNTLNSLQTLLGVDIPKVSELAYDTLGYTVKNKRIVGISLYGLGLTTIPDEIFRFEQLKHIALNENSINSIPSKISLLKGLEKLELSDNKLTDICNELTQLTGLKSLYLDANELIRLPEEIGNWTELRVLRIEGNKLKRVPSSFFNLTKLRNLHLDQYNILSQSIGDLSNLKNLSSITFHKEDAVVRYKGIKSIQDLGFYYNGTVTYTRAVN